MSDKLIDTSAARIAADILIAGFNQNNSFTAKDTHTNNVISRAICDNYTAMHTAVLEALAKEELYRNQGKIR